MQKKYAAQYLAVYDRMKEDADYLSLVKEQETATPGMLKALDEMAPEHRDAVLDYLGVVFAANAKLLELSLMVAEKS